MQIRQEKPGTKRLRNRFLFFPKTIGKELRWLEFVTWEEMYRLYPAYSKDVHGFWVPTQWVDD